ncbi:hypothetical protein ACTHQ4_10430 [Alkalicoccobacillus gibsonii]|uniref:hypothetical protein n=1 Tax=Alkalicoccobacillus gibsonii TaxID=79881 RepID=UPI003F7CCEB8
MNEYITEVSEAIGEINRLAVLANMEQPGIVEVESSVSNHFLLVRVVVENAIHPHNLHYNPSMLGLFKEQEILGEFDKCIEQLKNITNQAAQTA